MVDKSTELHELRGWNILDGNGCFVLITMRHLPVGIMVNEWISSVLSVLCWHVVNNRHRMHKLQCRDIFKREWCICSITVPNLSSWDVVREWIEYLYSVPIWIVVEQFSQLHELRRWNIFECKWSFIGAAMHIVPGRNMVHCRFESMLAMQSRNVVDRDCNQLHELPRRHILKLWQFSMHGLPSR